MRNCERSELLWSDQARVYDRNERAVLVLKYHPALLDVHRILKKMQILVHVSPLLKSLLPEPHMVSFRRSRNLEDNLVKAKSRGTVESVKGLFCCGKARCKVCRFVKTDSTFKSTVEGRSSHINHSFECDSSGVAYLITCKCSKQYIRSTITPYRIRFNNRKSSLNRFGRGQRGICGEHLYPHFYVEDCLRLQDVIVEIKDITDVRKPTERESFWIEKLKCFIPLGLNVKEF